MSVADRRRAGAAVFVTVVVFLSSAYTQPVQVALTPDDARRGALIDGIADEALAYSYRNPDLRAWGQTTVDPWVEMARSARGLSERLDTEIGVVRGGIGHFTFTGQANGVRVYTYDTLGLTRLDVARLDMHGEELRVGHAKRAPDVLIAANPRVDFHAPYFEGWVDVAGVPYDGKRFVLLDLDLLDPLVEFGVITEQWASELRAWILERLSAPQIDRNFVTFLTMRYHRDDEVRARVLELGALDEQSAWRRWLSETEESRTLLRPNGCAGWSFFECVSKAFDRHRAEPIPHLPNEPDWVDRP